MTPWATRALEERSLLNPSFCSLLIWHAAAGLGSADQRRLSFEESFLILPLTLHRQTRDSLPRDTRTSLANWLETNPLARGVVASRAEFLVPFTKEALTFGGIHRLFHFEQGGIVADTSWEPALKGSLKSSTDEVKHCAKRASFVGKWFACGGSSTTVLALMGVRP